MGDHAYAGKRPVTDFESPCCNPPAGSTGALRRSRSGTAPLPGLAAVAGGDEGFSSRIFFQGRAVRPQCADDIRTRVRELVAARLGVEECDIQSDSDFRNDLGAESFEMVELVMALEAEFGVKVADDDAKRVETVRRATDYLEEAMSAWFPLDHRPIPWSLPAKRCAPPPARAGSEMHDVSRSDYAGSSNPPRVDPALLYPPPW